MADNILGEGEEEGWFYMLCYIICIFIYVGVWVLGGGGNYGGWWEWYGWNIWG